MTTFPASPEALSTEWLSEVLGEEVSNYRIEPLGAGVGIIGLVTRLEFETPSGRRTLIAKFPAPAVENRAIASAFRMYFREYTYYTKISQRVPVRAPVCHFAAYDEASEDFILLLEDLTDYRVGDQVAGCTVAEAEQVIEALAGLHGNTWEAEVEGIDRHNTEAQVAGMTAGFEAGWPVLREKFPALVTPEVFAAAEIMPQKIEKLLARICQSPLCINHGDVRLDNVFFSPDEIALVDFQAVCRSAPEHDLAYFVTQSLGATVRNARDWPALYHEKLTGQGITYPLAALRERYGFCALYFLCYAVVICSALDLANERGRLLGETLLGNSLQSLDEINAFQLLEDL